ncbi:MAG TPA: VOC family protein [bacterium]|nr:VOC family protein [bacterium]
MPANTIPDRYHTVTPYIVVDGAAKVIDFAVTVFGRESDRAHDQTGRPRPACRSADRRLGVVMVSDTGAQFTSMPAMLYVYVPDVDATYARALRAGAASIMEPADQFYGDRHGGVRDSAGNQWWIATHVEDVSPEEMQRRSQAAFKTAAGP